MSILFSVCPSPRPPYYRVHAVWIQVTIRRMDDYEELTVTLPDGYRAYARCRMPTEPCGAVLYLHGIQSHCDWYDASAQRLARAGYAVLQVDRRGCGRNSQDRGHADSAEQLIDDTLAARDELLRRFGCDEYHMVGVSWGGKLAAASHVTDAQGVLSLSLVTPGLFPRVTVSDAEKAEIGMAMLYAPRRLFDIPLNDPKLFTASPRWQEFFRNDTGTLRQCTAGFYLASRRMDRIVANLPNAPPTSLHLVLAGDEQIIDNDKTSGFIHSLGWTHSKISVYPRARHSLEFETEAEEYFDALISFISDAKPTHR